MSYRLKPAPQSGPHDTLPLNDWRNVLPANSDVTRFSRSWLSYDPAVRPGLELPNINNALNWDAVLGLTLATVMSGCFWAVIGLTIAQVWK